MTTPDTPAPEMEAEFVRLARNYGDSCKYCVRRVQDEELAALHRWYREQVERARKAGYLAASGGDIFGYEEAFRDD